MKARVFTLSAVLMMGVLTAPVWAQAGPQGLPDHSQRVWATADGGVCSFVEAQQLYRCRSFVMTEYRDVTGQYRETRVTLNQWRNWPGGYANRTIECPVGRNAFRVMRNKAVVDVTFDADSPACIGYGETVTYEPYSVQPWLYTGLQTLQADLLSPRYTDTFVTNHSYRDDQLGTGYRDNCRGGSGWEPLAGGFTMVGLYRDFGPEDATGSYWYQNCGTTEK
jgi:hypothetical protein